MSRRSKKKPIRRTRKIKSRKKTRKKTRKIKSRKVKKKIFSKKKLKVKDSEGNIVIKV